MYYKPSARTKMRRRTRFLIFIVIIAAAVVAGGYFIYSAITGFTLEKSPVTQTEVRLPESVTCSKDGIIFYQDGALSMMDKTSGALKWSIPISGGGDYRVSSSDSLICVYAGSNLQLVSTLKESLFSKTITTEILNVACGKNYVAFLTNEADETGAMRNYITIVDKKGDEKSKLDFASREVLTFGFSGENDMFWANALDTSGVVPVSYVATYKVDGQMTSSIEINSQVVEDVSVTSGSIYTFGTSDLFSYSYFGERQGAVSVYGWHIAAKAITSQGVFFACVPRTTAATIESVSLYDTNLKQTLFRLPRNCFSIAVSPQKLYAFSENKIHLYAPAGFLESTVNLKTFITSAKQIYNDTAILWDNNNSYIYPLG